MLQDFMKSRWWWATFLLILFSTGRASEYTIDYDIAIRQDGELHGRFLHLKEPDGDASKLPGSENGMGLRFRWDPQWILDDFTVFFARITVGSPELFLGEGRSTLTLEQSSPQIPFHLGGLGMDWQTPLGTLRLGRIPYRYGLGVFFPGGETDWLRYGISLDPGSDDQVRFSFAPLGVNHPLKITILVRNFVEGSRSPEGILQDGIGYGGELAWEGGENRYSLWGDYEIRSSQRTSLGFLDLFLTQRLPYLRLNLEAGVRWGRWGGIPGAEVSLRKVEFRSLKRMGYGGVFQIVAGDEVRSGSTSFSGSGVEMGWFSGDALEGAFSGEKWRWFSSHRDFRVGLLLFPYLWQARQQALANLWISTYEELLPRGAEELRTAFFALIPAGPGNVLYLFPGFSLKTQDELRFRIHLLYARALRPIPTLEVLDRRGTAIRADDLYVQGQEYGFELDTHLSYPVWGSMYGVLEAGVAFPGNIFKNATGGKAPTAFGIFPRLTIFF